MLILLKRNIRLIVTILVTVVLVYSTVLIFRVSKSDTSSFFVISTVFNPAGFAKRYENYHKFKTYMKESGAQLVTVEVIFPSLNQTSFQVTDPSDPNDIQLTSDSVYWMKENLINVAASKLPPHAHYICWLDADVFYPEEPNWVEKIIESLNGYAVTQAFEGLDYLGPTGEVFRRYKSFAYSAVHKVKEKGMWYTPGFGWAMHTSAFWAMGGIPDCDIVGGGDLHFASCLVDPAGPTPVKIRESEEAKNGYEALTQWVEENEMKGVLTYAQLKMAHRWHGSKKDRNYAERVRIIEDNQFNCEKDMFRLENGLKSFMPGTEKLQKDVLNYFLSRKEDGDTYSGMDVDKTV